MKKFCAMVIFPILILSWGSVNALDNNKNPDNGRYYSMKTTKGTREFYQVDYNKVSQDIQVPITNHQSSALGSRGSRLDINDLPNTGAVNPSSPLKSRGTRHHDSC